MLGGLLLRYWLKCWRYAVSEFFGQVLIGQVSGNILKFLNAKDFENFDHQSFIGQLLDVLQILNPAV